MKPTEVQRLYELFGHRVYTRCLFLLREEQRAMDMTQDTYLAALDKMTLFSSDGKAAAWLLKVATNRCLNEIRRQKYWRSIEFDEGAGAVSHRPFPIFESRMFFEKLLVSLPVRKATIVVGYFLEGKTMEEIAAETGYSVPTVRRTIAGFVERGRRKLGVERNDRGGDGDGN